MKSLLQCRRSGRFAPLGRIFSGGLRAMIVPEGEHCTEKQWSKRNISTSNSTFFHNHEMSGDLRRFLEEVRWKCKHDLSLLTLKDVKHKHKHMVKCARSIYMFVLCDRPSESSLQKELLVTDVSTMLHFKII